MRTYSLAGAVTRMCRSRTESRSARPAYLPAQFSTRRFGGGNTGIDKRPRPRLPVSKRFWESVTAGMRRDEAWMVDATQDVVGQQAACRGLPKSARRHTPERNRIVDAIDMERLLGPNRARQSGIRRNDFCRAERALSCNSWFASDHVRSPPIGMRRLPCVILLRLTVSAPQSLATSCVRPYEIRARAGSRRERRERVTRAFAQLTLPRQ